MSETIKLPERGGLVLDWLRGVLVPWLMDRRLVAGRGVSMYRGAGGTLISATGAWSGVAYVAGKPFRDTSMVPDEISGSDGTITDNSTDGAKTWIKIDVSPSAEVVSYEDSPVFVSGRFPEDTEYYERASTAGDIHVTRFG